MFRLNLPLQRRSRRAGSSRQDHNRGFRHVARALTLLAALALLTACGSSGNSPDNRIFANNPAQQTMPATVAPPPTRVAPPTPTSTSPASPAALLAVRGASSGFYVSVGGQLLAIDGNGTARELALPAHAILLGFAWSPDGEHVAVAVGQRDGTTRDRTDVSLLVLDKHGMTARTVTNILTLSGAMGTPATSATPSRVMVDWGLVDSQIAIATDRGALVLIPAKGEPKTIAVDLKGQTVRAMRISPRGDTAALLTADASGRGTVVVVSLSLSKPQAPNGLVGFAVDRKHSITAFSWLSDGLHLLFTQADQGADPLTGGELYLMNTKTQDVRLIDTGGRAGPSAGIIAFAPSPDGKSVAYLIGVPEASSWVANSLWVRSLRGPGLLPVPIGNAEEIDGLWWTSAGLVWATRVDAGNGYEMIYFVQPPNGPPHEVLRIAVKPGAPATPGATPVGSPVASPMATPAATPKATGGH